MCIKFGVDSASRFPFRARTDRQTDATERPTHAGGYAGVGNDYNEHLRQRTLHLKFHKDLLKNNTRHAIIY